MENPEDAGVFLHTFRTLPCMKLSGDERVEPEQAGQGETEQEQMENNGGPAKMASIEFRIQQLHNRRFLLLKIKRCTKKDEQHSGGSSEEHQPQQRPSYKETPRGGIYMLPPPQSSEQVTAAAQEPADSILPVEKLGGTSGVTMCPSCKEVVVTETHSTRSDTMWILCFLCCFIGNVHHQCPRCQAKIYTHQLL
ncbi:hypothetical protein GOODEAATRI_029153 [Goodea atripinnis]|uniref:LITAF domain-containing protein n=1 Tax=Goodea atripinnis TaxID=208336 RepID=A0ABV0MLM3_9TELE